MDSFLDLLNPLLDHSFSLLNSLPVNLLLGLSELLQMLLLNIVYYLPDILARNPLKVPLDNNLLNRDVLLVSVLVFSTNSVSYHIQMIPNSLLANRSH